MPTIVHFEIPADDVERARKFYTDLFGWKIEKTPEMDYWMVTTSGEKQVDGGMMKRQDPQQQITNYFAVCLDTENNAFALWQSDKNAK
jgi:predicted enzyme related to lactoylglutathione lyase